MANHSRPPKRPRTDSDSSKPIEPIHSHIWKPFGDIILQAESTQFRVNRDVLAGHSPVFRDMFSVPQPANEPTIEGSPVVPVSDSAKDWELLLELLYSPFDRRESIPFDLLAAMLRLGKKYDMDTIKDNALWRIHHEFPNNLESWDEVRDEDSDMTKIESDSALLMDLLNLTYECGVRSSIPSLAYCCLASTSLKDLIQDCCRRNDESIVILDKDIKLALAVATEKIFDFQKTHYSWLTGERIPTKGCKSRSGCRQTRRDTYHALMVGGVEQKYRYYMLKEWGDESFPSAGFCEACYKAGRERFNETRSEAWDSLPGFFDLPDWENLKDFE